MIKNPFSILRYTAMIVCVASLFILAGCSDDDKEPAPTMTTSEILASSDYKQSSNGNNPELALDSLNKLLNLYPDLQTLLTGSTEYTLFAPSNKAFINLLATPGFPQNISQISPDLIKGVLSYHFVAGTKLKADLTAGSTLTSLFTDPNAPGSAQTITVNSNGTLKAAPNATNTDIDIVKADIKATNGVVHIIESVMIPPSTGAVLVPILGTMAGTVLLGKDFTYLAQLVLKADAGFTEGANLNQKKIVTLLAIPSTTAGFPGATFFAPPNPVITAAAGSAGVPAFIGSFSSASARALLLNHYVLGKFVVTATSGSATITDATTATNMNGVTLKFKTGLPPASAPSYGVIVTTDLATTAKWVPIYSKDLVHSNGLIQVTAGIIQ